MINYVLVLKALKQVYIHVEENSFYLLNIIF